MEQPIKIHNENGFLTIEGTNNCLGFLMDFKGHGVFDASIGKVDVTPEQADKHNALLSEAYIKGLEKCEVGQSGTFYYTGGAVKTFTGTLVSSDVTRHGNSLTFRFKGMTFRGRLQKASECFNFKRVA